MKAKYLIVEWPDRASVLFQLVGDTYTYFDSHNIPDSSLDDWDTSEATIHEVHL